MLPKQRFILAPQKSGKVLEKWNISVCSRPVLVVLWRCWWPTCICLPYVIFFGIICDFFFCFWHVRSLIKQLCDRWRCMQQQSLFCSTSKNGHKFWQKRILSCQSDTKLILSPYKLVCADILICVENQLYIFQQLFTELPVELFSFL